MFCLRHWEAQVRADAGNGNRAGLPDSSASLLNVQMHREAPGNSSDNMQLRQQLRQHDKPTTDGANCQRHKGSCVTSAKPFPSATPGPKDPKSLSLALFKVCHFCSLRLQVFYSLRFAEVSYTVLSTWNAILSFLFCEC